MGPTFIFSPSESKWALSVLASLLFIAPICWVRTVQLWEKHQRLFFILVVSLKQQNHIAFIQSNASLGYSEHKQITTSFAFSCLLGKLSVLREQAPLEDLLWKECSKWIKTKGTHMANIRLALCSSAVSLNAHLKNKNRKYCAQHYQHSVLLVFRHNWRSWSKANRITSIINSVPLVVVVPFIVVFLLLGLTIFYLVQKISSRVA